MSLFYETYGWIANVGGSGDVATFRGMRLLTGR